MKTARVLGCLFLLPVLLLFLAAPAMAQTTANGGHYYYYFNERIPLNCDTSQIAVYESAAALKSNDALSMSLSRHGIASKDITRSAVPNLCLCKTNAREEQAVREMVKGVSLEREVEFASPVFSSAQSRQVVMSQYLHVGFNEKVDAQQAEAILAKFGAGTIEERDWAGMKNVYRVRSGLRDGFEVLALANKLAELPETDFAEADMLMTSTRSLIPNDPLFPNLWGLHNTGQSGGTPDMDMDGPEAWDISTGDPSVFVVILDDGVQQNHPDINQIPGMDFTGSGTGGGPFNVCDNHGTTVAGCTSATINNGIGVVGIAPACKVASAKFTISNVPCDGSGSFYPSWLVNALTWAQTIGARVTNNSNGLPAISSITTKYQQTYDAGIIHFSSSGNSGTSGIGYPANLPTVIAVGAINRLGNRASFSTYGTDLAFMAPGQTIQTTDRTGSAGFASGDYATVDGTSYSSPYAAGVAAMVLTVDNTLTPPEIEQIMNETCMDRGTVGYDLFYGWGIVNAHDAMAAASPPGPTLLDGSCFYDPAMLDPVLNLTVDIFNLDSGASWPTAIVNNGYSLTLQPGTDINVGDTLRYIALDDTTAINVTDHVVTQTDVDSENIHLDLVLDEYYLNLADFPMYEADGPDVNQMAGPAVAQMALNYIWWDSTVDPTPPLLFDSQQDLFDYGVAFNETPGLSVLDTRGMWRTIQDNRPLPYTQYGYNFSIRQNVASAEMIKQIAQWISYPIGTFGGHEQGYPLHVPGVIPAFGDYGNWMAVRGMHASENAYPLQSGLEVFGFWLNDPVPAVMGGIGENSYKTVTELLATYYLPLATGDSYDGKFVAICEPPDPVGGKVIELATSKLRFDAHAKLLTTLARDSAAVSAEVKAAADQAVIDAATAGVNEELVPYDPAFAALFGTTIAANPLFVSNDLGADYYIVPLFGRSATVVVLVDGDEGQFKETSWLDRATTYPPVSAELAAKLAQAALDQQGIDFDLSRAGNPELVRRGDSPYYPDWRFGTDELAIYVSQNGEVTIEKH